ncbi:hypothetical protein Tco_1346368 [Tanacetum coccineum]
MVSLFELRKLFFQVVGARVGVDCCGRGVIGEIVEGLIGGAAVEVSGKLLQSDEIKELCNGTSVFCVS